jgi:hypothetical protein
MREYLESKLVIGGTKAAAVKQLVTNLRLITTKDRTALPAYLQPTIRSCESPQVRTGSSAFVGAVAYIRINPHVSGGHARAARPLRCRRGSSPTASFLSFPSTTRQLATTIAPLGRPSACSRAISSTAVVPPHYRVAAASEAAISSANCRTYSESIGSGASSVFGPNSLWRSRKRTHAFQRRIASSLPAGLKCSAAPKSCSALTVQS